MEPALEKLIVDAVAHQWWAYSWVFGVGSAILAGVGAVIGAYLKKSAELIATNRNFQTSLAQLREQTRAAELIKSELSSQLDVVKDIRERDRSYSQFQRDDIAVHVSALIASAIQLISIFEIAGRSAWVDSVDLAIVQQQIAAETSASRLRLSILMGYKVISERFASDLSQALSSISRQWEQLVNQLILKDSKFRQQHPDEPEFDATRYHREWHTLQERAAEFIGAIGES
jgi:hypothetical protein